MSYATRRAALASLRQYTPEVRARHNVVRYYSETHRAYRYAVVYGSVK